MLLLLLFLAVPLIEIALFIQLGSILDLGWILLIVVLTAILGTWLVRRQGRDVLVQLQRSMDQLRDPTEPLAHGAMILFSGALLLTPGFFTDAVGFLLLVPAVRRLAYRRLKASLIARQSMRQPPPPRPDIIDAEYTEVEPEPEPGPKPGPRRTEGPSGWTRH